MNQQHALNEIKRTINKLLLISFLIHKVASFFYLNLFTLGTERIQFKMKCTGNKRKSDRGSNPGRSARHMPGSDALTN